MVVVPLRLQRGVVGARFSVEESPARCAGEPHRHVDEDTRKNPLAFSAWARLKETALPGWGVGYELRNVSASPMGAMSLRCRDNSRRRCED